MLSNACPRVMCLAFVRLLLHVAASKLQNARLEKVVFSACLNNTKRKHTVSLLIPRPTHLHDARIIQHER